MLQAAAPESAYCFSNVQIESITTIAEGAKVCPTLIQTLKFDGSLKPPLPKQRKEEEGQGSKRLRSRGEDIIVELESQSPTLRPKFNSNADNDSMLRSQCTSGE